jgi:hypothetical protein
MRERVVHGMSMVFRRDHRELLTGGAELVHVCMGQRGVIVHEHAVRPAVIGYRAAEFGEHRLDAVGVGDINAALEHGQGAAFVADAHPFDSDCQHNVGGTGAHVQHCLVQCGCASGTSIFDIDYRNALESHGPQRHLTRHYDLAFEHALTSVAEVAGLYVAKCGARVGQCRRHRLASQLLDRGLRPNPERGHPYPDDPHFIRGHAADSSVSWASPYACKAPSNSR